MTLKNKTHLPICKVKGGHMKQRNLTPYEELAMRMFDDYGVRAYSGFMYNCKLVINCSPTDLNMNCITWVGMN